MYSCVDIHALSDTAVFYESQLKQAFPKLGYEPSRRDTHLAIFRNGIIVGGITLERFEDLSQDDVIAGHWKVLKKQKAIKLKRLWIAPRQPSSLLFKIYLDVVNRVERDDFLYGVLSFPLLFAKENSFYFQDNHGFLSPKNPVADLQWEAHLESTSEGKKLLKMYAMLGAEPLGELSGNPVDFSVRGVMGMFARDFNYQTISDKYA